MMTLPQTKATVFHGGKVVQFDRHAKTVTEHDCLVSIGSTIIYVGSDDETKVAELVQNVPLKNVQHVDLKGRYLLPGFIDSHVHLLEFSLAKYEANKLSLKGVKGVEAVKAAIMDYREKHSHLNVIICTDWLRDKDDKEDDIVAKTLDEVDSEHPIIIEAADSHSSWCNQKTMDHAEFKLKDITDKYPYDPSKPNPQVKYDHDGKACGYFAESAHLVYVHKFLFDIHTPEQRQEALKNACKLYHEAGYTGIVGMFTKQYEWDVLEEFMKQQKEDSGEYPFHYGTYWAAPDKAGVKEAIEWHKNHRKTGNKEFVRSPLGIGSLRRCFPRIPRDAPFKDDGPILIEKGKSLLTRIIAVRFRDEDNLGRCHRWTYGKPVSQLQRHRGKSRPIVVNQRSERCGV